MLEIRKFDTSSKDDSVDREEIVVSKRRKPEIPKPRGHTKVDDLYLGFLNAGETKPLTKKTGKRP
jgi:hypothetical protein